MTTTAIDPAVEDERFSAVVRAATAEEHTAAENTLYVRELLAGNVAREGFERLVVHHLAIYSALEDAAEVMVSDPVAGGFVYPELHRRDALVADVSALDVEPDVLVPGPATERYVARIREQCTTRPEAFVAHHYTRYLGDLFGGQLLGRVAARVYELPDGEGTSFYRFDQIPEKMPFVHAYRDRLDSVPWDDETRGRMVDEARVAFQLNTAVFEELAVQLDLTES